MRIDDLEVGGISGPKLRDLFKRRRFLAVKDVERIVGATRAEKVFSDLRAGGYLDPADQWGRYPVSDRGRRVGKAKLTARISRKTADRALEKFLGRCEVLKTEESLIYRVEQAILFGSYLSNASDLGDIDIAVRLSPKTKDHERWRAMRKASIEEAEAAGRHFASFSRESFYPEDQVMVFLKARSRFLDLVNTEDFEPETEYRVIYTDAESALS